MLQGPLCKRESESQKQMSDLVKGTANEMLRAQYAELMWNERQKMWDSQLGAVSRHGHDCLAGCLSVVQFAVTTDTWEE